MALVVDAIVGDKGGSTGMYCGADCLRDLQGRSLIESR